MVLTDVVAARRFGHGNRSYLLAEKQVCGCFYCKWVFESDCLTEDDFDVACDAGQTAFCPFCGIDAVIGSACGVAVNAAFLVAMHHYWFE